MGLFQSVLDRFFCRPQFLGFLERSYGFLDKVLFKESESFTIEGFSKLALLLIGLVYSIFEDIMSFITLSNAGVVLLQLKVDSGEISAKSYL